MTRVARPFRGVSAEDRRAQRRARLLEAGLDVLGDDGVGGLTMTAVCARAGLTERYFYESFRNRSALLAALVDDVCDELHEATVAALEAAPQDLTSRARAAAAVMVGGLTDDRRKARLFVEATGDPTLRQRRAVAVRRFAELLAAQMRVSHHLDALPQEPPGAPSDEPPHEPPRQERLKLTALILVGGAAEAMVSWLDGGVRLSRDELIDECARLCAAAAEAIAPSRCDLGQFRPL